MKFGAGQDRILLISISISIENERTLLWGSVGKNPIDFDFNFSKTNKKEISGTPNIVPDKFLF